MERVILESEGSGMGLSWDEEFGVMLIVDMNL
jgi:hypothetical protein